MIDARAYKLTHKLCWFACFVTNQMNELSFRSNFYRRSIYHPDYINQLKILIKFVLFFFYVVHANNTHALVILSCGYRFTFALIRILCRPDYDNQHEIWLQMNGIVRITFVYTFCVLARGMQTMEQLSINEHHHPSCPYSVTRSPKSHSSLIFSRAIRFLC